MKSNNTQFQEVYQNNQACSNASCSSGTSNSDANTNYDAAMSGITALMLCTRLPEQGREALLVNYVQVGIDLASMVCAGHRLAAEAGVEMLRRGGNAVDAAVAAAWAVGVVEPWMSGAGGVGAMVIHHGGRQVIVDFGLRAPLAARADMYTLLPDGGSQGQYGWPAIGPSASRASWPGCVRPTHASARCPVRR